MEPLIVHHESVFSHEEPSVETKSFIPFEVSHGTYIYDDAEILYFCIFIQAQLNSVINRRD